MPRIEDEIPIPWFAVEYQGGAPNLGSLNAVFQNLQRQILNRPVYVANIITGGGVTTTPFPISVGDTVGRPFSLRVVVNTVDDVTATTTQNQTYNEDILMGFTPSPGVSVIQGVANLVKITQGIPALITYTASGTAIIVTITGAPYGGPNAFARIEFVSPMRDV